MSCFLGCVHVHHDHAGCYGGHSQLVGQVWHPSLPSIPCLCLHSVWTVWHCPCYPLCCTEWVGEIYQQSCHGLAGLHGVPLHHRHSALCIQDSREILPWKSGHSGIIHSSNLLFIDILILSFTATRFSTVLWLLELLFTTMAYLTWLCTGQLCFSHIVSSWW